MQGPAWVTWAVVGVGCVVESALQLSLKPRSRQIRKSRKGIQAGGTAWARVPRPVGSSRKTGLHETGFSVGVVQDDSRFCRVSSSPSSLLSHVVPEFVHGVKCAGFSLCII